MNRKTRNWILILLIITGIYIAARLTNTLAFYKVNTTAMMPAYQKGDLIMAYVLKRPAFNRIICYKAVSHDSMQLTDSICFQRVAGMEGDTIEINDGYLLRNGLIADRPQKRMFNYYAMKWAIYDMKILDNLSIKPVIIKDSIVLNLTAYEYQKLSRNALLHKINKPKQQKETGIAGSTGENWWNASNYGPLIVPKGYCFVLGDNRDNSMDSRYIGLVPIRNIVATDISGK